MSAAHAKHDSPSQKDGGETKVHQTPRSTRITQHKLKIHSNFCCIAKEYYSEYSNMVDSLHIMPRLMIHQKSFKANSTYGLTLLIRNSGLYPRMIKCSTDSAIDTTISIIEEDLHRYLNTDETLEVKIWIRSRTWRDINRRRHIFVESFHPNVIFQVPIIVLENLNDPSVSESITFPASVPGNMTYYEMIIYNPSKDRIRLRLRNTYSGLSINTLNKDLLPPQDYIKVWLTLLTTKLQIYKGFFNLKFGVAPPRMVNFEFIPKSMGVYVSGGHCTFGPTKFSGEDRRTIHICNESPHEVFINSEFLSEPHRDTGSFSMGTASKMNEEAISMHSILLYDFGNDEGLRRVSYDFRASKHFSVSAPTKMDAGSVSNIILTFRPAYDRHEPFSDDIEPPYFQRTKVHFCVTDRDECIETHFVVVSGEVAGIEVEVHPKVIDFRKIYLGEEHCAHIKILNVDGVMAKVNFKDYQEPDMGGVRITPSEGFLLEPCTRGIFHLSFFSTVSSRFTVILRFKVENGAHYKVLIKGMGQHVQLRTFPQLVEFGSIPMAVPQKRYMLLMNPLAVPITLQVQATDDGEEQPLVLNIRDSTEMLPITIRDPIKHLQRVQVDLLNSNTQLDDDDIEFTFHEPESLSIKSYKQNESIYSAEFEEDVMEPVPQMAAHLLTSLKKQKIFDKAETDKRVIQEALQGLLNTKYFSIFTKHNNFIFMDWNAIPSDPQEVYCDNEIIYLRPNTGRSITILIVPNKVGYFHRSLSVRICPAIPSASPGSSDDEQNNRVLIKSDFLCSKLWFEYNCCAPDIEWYNFVDLSNRIIYAGEEYHFEMQFSNMSSVGGFLHFDVIPNEMSFRDGTWKYYIGSGGQITAKCSVTFRSVGNTKLSGLLKIVGIPRPYPFHLFANVLPTEIKITPNYVHRRLQVYELSKVHFYIDNHSPTNTKLIMNLVI